LEALSLGVVQVSFVITDGQYSLNKKETSDDNEIVGEEGLYPIVGASADDNFTVEDQHEPSERQNNQGDVISFSQIGVNGHRPVQNISQESSTNQETERGD